jgi:hypothetical protein
MTNHRDAKLPVLGSNKSGKEEKWNLRQNAQNLQNRNLGLHESIRSILLILSRPITFNLCFLPYAS